MILLQINVSVNIGSTGRIAEQIGQVAMSHGWESYIAYGRSANPSQSHLIRIGSELDVYNHVLYTRLTDRHGLSSKRATHFLIEKIKELQPDIIHLHNIHGYYVNYPILFDYLNQAKIPIVWTLHDCWAFTGHCAYFTRNGCYKWLGHCGDCPLSSDYPKSIYDNSKNNLNLKREYFTKCNKLILVPVSVWLSKFIKKSFFNKYPINIIHNGIDLKKFNRFEIKSSNKIRILGVANRWDPRKGLSDFFKLRLLLPLEKYEIKLVGLSSKQIRKLPNGIFGIERTNSVDDLALLYSEATVYLNLTYDDNFPTTNLESLACGTPIITYNTGGSPEAISSMTGFVVEQGDLNGVVKAIKTIESYGKEFFINNCRKRAEDNFDIQKQFEKYFELYETLLKNNHVNI